MKKNPHAYLILLFTNWKKYEPVQLADGKQLIYSTQWSKIDLHPKNQALAIISTCKLKFIKLNFWGLHNEEVKALEADHVPVPHSDLSSPKTLNDTSAAICTVSMDACVQREERGRRGYGVDRIKHSGWKERGNYLVLLNYRIWIKARVGYSLLGRSNWHRRAHGRQTCLHAGG